MYDWLDQQKGRVATFTNHLPRVNRKASLHCPGPGELRNVEEKERAYARKNPETEKETGNLGNTRKKQK